ncbi:MAG: transporter, family, inner rane transport protein [Actinomycetota bacterium]|nr:transporter, family, inner rane transport protein [Actinomycetota bacterium]
MSNDSRAGTSRTVRPGLLALGTFAAGTDAFLVSGVLPSLAHDLHVSAAAAGQTVTVFALTYALAAPLLAVTTQRLDRRTALLIALALLTGANALSALAPTFAVLLGARFIAALGAAQFTPHATAVVATTTPPDRRGRALAVLVGGLSAGTVIGLPAGTLLGGQAGWRAAFWLVTAITIVALLGTAWGMPSLRLPSAGWRERLRPLRDRELARLLATTVTTMIGPYAVMTYIAVVLAPATGGRASILSALLVLNGLGAVAGSALAGHLVDRAGPRPVLSAQFAALFLGLGGLAAGRTSLPVSAVLLVVWGLAGFGTAVVQQHRLALYAGPSAPLVLGLNGSAIYLGSTLGAALGGVVLGRLAGGADVLPVIAAFVLVIPLVLSVPRDMAPAGTPAGPGLLEGQDSAGGRGPGGILPVPASAGTASVRGGRRPGSPR